MLECSDSAEISHVPVLSGNLCPWERSTMDLGLVALVALTAQSETPSRERAALISNLCERYITSTRLDMLPAMKPYPASPYAFTQSARLRKGCRLVDRCLSCGSIQHQNLYLPPKRPPSQLLLFAAPCSTFLSKSLMAWFTFLPASLLNSWTFFSVWAA